jgi:antitoxin component of RelBE/YafQ-DinJ toxin-antitoxin module
MSVRLDPTLRQALENYIEQVDMTPSAAVRVLLSDALKDMGIKDVEQHNALLEEARREVRATAKEALQRALKFLEGDD